MLGQDNDPRSRVRPLEAPGNLKPGQARQVNAQQNDIGSQFPATPEPGFPRRSLADLGDFTAIGKDMTQPGPDQGLVINDEYVNHVPPFGQIQCELVVFLSDPFPVSDVPFIS